MEIHKPEKKKRGKNISFYHFCIQEINPNDKDKLLEKQYYRTAYDVCDKYKISRASLYRILKDPNANTTIPFKIEKVYLHKTALEYIS